MKDTGFLYREKDTVELIENDRQKIEVDEVMGRATLMMKEAEAEDAGLYILTAKNMEGRDYSWAKVSIKGKVPPCYAFTAVTSLG